jgi:hypothetical protein
MPTAFARFDARGNGVCSAAYALALPVGVAGRDVRGQPLPQLTLEQAARRNTRRRCSCFVAWPSVS